MAHVSLLIAGMNWEKYLSVEEVTGEEKENCEQIGTDKRMRDTLLDSLADVSMFPHFLHLSMLKRDWNFSQTENHSSPKNIKVRPEKHGSGKLLRELLFNGTFTSALYIGIAARTVRLSKPKD